MVAELSNNEIDPLKGTQSAIYVLIGSQKCRQRWTIQASLPVYTSCGLVNENKLLVSSMGTLKHCPPINIKM